MKKRLRKKLRNYLMECCIESEMSFTDEDIKEVACCICSIHEKCNAKCIFDCPKGFRGIYKTDIKEIGEEQLKERRKLKLLKKHREKINQYMRYDKEFRQEINLIKQEGSAGFIF